MDVQIFGFKVHARGAMRQRQLPALGIRCHLRPFADLRFNRLRSSHLSKSRPWSRCNILGWTEGGSADFAALDAAQAAIALSANLILRD